MKCFLQLLLFLAISSSAIAQQQLELVHQAKQVKHVVCFQENLLCLKLPKKVKWKDVQLSIRSGSIKKQQERGYFICTPEHERVVIRASDNNDFYGEILLKGIKPMIAFQPAVGLVLYLNCANDIQLDLSNYTNDNTEISYEVEGAQLIPRSKLGLITLYPNKAKVHLHIAKNGKEIKKLTFHVMKIPNPTIHPMLGNRGLDMKGSVSIDELRTKSVKIVSRANRDFLSFFPRETGYEVVKVQVSLVQNDEIIKSEMMTLEYEIMDLKGFLNEATSGDRLVIELKEVTRTNSLGRVEFVRGLARHTFSVTLK